MLYSGYIIYTGPMCEVFNAIVLLYFFMSTLSASQTGTGATLAPQCSCDLLATCTTIQQLGKYVRRCKTIQPRCGYHIV